MLRNAATGRVIWWGCEHLPNATNNEAEYNGLEIGLRAAVLLGAHHVDVRGDSQLILTQIAGSAKVNATTLRPSYNKCRALLSQIVSSTLTHRFREANKCADRIANFAADGWTVQRWTNGVPRQLPRGIPPSQHRADVPDLATALLGIPPHSVEATVCEPVDWFQLVRLSVLRHIYDARNAAIRNNLCVGASEIKRDVARDFIRVVQLRLAAEIPCGALRVDSVLRNDVDRKNASVADFYDIEAW